MTRDSSVIRWLGLEVGSRRYAVDLHEISHALIWPKKVVGSPYGLHNAQGLFVHDGRTIVVVDPDLLFQGTSNGAANASGDHLPSETLAASTASPTSAPLDSWLVVFRSHPALVACGIRVDRTVGPFRVAGVTLQALTNAATEVEYSGLRWRVVSANPALTAHSPDFIAEETLP